MLITVVCRKNRNLTVKLNPGRDLVRYNGMMMVRPVTLFLIIALLFADWPQPASAGNEVVQTLLHTTFNEFEQRASNGWRAEQHCRTVVRNDFLSVEAFGGEPQIFRTIDNFNGGDFHLFIEMRTRTESTAALYWTSRGSFRISDEHQVILPLNEDGDWHIYDFEFNVPDILESLMLRFSAPDGSWDIRSIKLIRRTRPPMVVHDAVPIVHEGREMIRLTVSNSLLVPLDFRVANQPANLRVLRGNVIDFGVPIRTRGHLASAVLTLHPEGYPCMIYPVFLYRHEGDTDWIQRPLANDKMLEIAPDGAMARFWQGDTLFGIIAPIVHRDGEVPDFVLADDSTESELHFDSADIELRIRIGSPLLTFDIRDKNSPITPSDEDEISGVGNLEGPVVRLFGDLRSGLLPGVEFLGSGGVSSAQIDVAQPFHDRSRPEPIWMTMPLAVLETEKGGAALYWDDSSLQPVFSSPNLVDYTDDHRMSLISRRPDTPIRVSLELMSPGEEAASFRAIKSHVARKGFPSLPTPLRTADAQLQIYRHAIGGPLQSEMGGTWGYALEPQWERKPFADMISTSARLSEAVGHRSRNPGILVPGGSDITNDMVYFLFGRIIEWQQERESALQQIIVTLNADGSFLFRTRFPEWETAASSFGYTALRALAIMEYVRITGNENLFSIVENALQFLERCEIPRGGYYLDAPFHTPDLQSAALLVWLYTWAYEYSRNDEYLRRAVHFAYAGLPFVYQISHRHGLPPEILSGESEPHVLYGTVGKFGGTHRRPPLHFGVISTRTGIQYAYALNLLSRFDHQTDWKTVAKGILQTMENLQYTEGEQTGCIPELFDIITQHPHGWTVNPCALISLHWAVNGRVDSLFVLQDGRNRYTAPYPMRITPEGVEAYSVPEGQRFHILHNANRYGTGEGNGLISID